MRRLAGRKQGKQLATPKVSTFRLSHINQHAYSTTFDLLEIYEERLAARESQVRLIPCVVRFLWSS